jgi:hypothetical protein
LPTRVDDRTRRGTLGTVGPAGKPMMGEEYVGTEVEFLTNDAAAVSARHRL